jgi:serine/threonine protein phosphatase PrpC
MRTASYRRCPNRECSAPVQDGDRFCERCGRRLRSQDDPPGMPLACPGCTDPVRALDPEGVCWTCGLQIGLEQGDRVEAVLGDVAGVSDRGRSRPRNEDAMALTALGRTGARVLVVCDGVSSCEAPAAAARSAAGACLGSLVVALRRGRTDLEVAMVEAIGAAHRAASRVAHPAVSDRRHPSSTIVAAVLAGRRATVGWVGDSRAYVQLADRVQQLTVDDSWGADMVRRGTMSEEEVRRDPRARALTNWIGGDDAGWTPRSSVATFDLPVGGRLLLCSDGLWSYAPTPERMVQMMAALPAAASPLTVARLLTDRALRCGGGDNVTVVVAAVDGEDEGENEVEER